MDEQELRDLFRTELARTPQDRAACPSPETLQQVATTAGDDDARLATLEHIATCASCRADFDLLRTAHAAAPEPAVATTAPARTMPRWIPALLAASVAIVASVALLREPADVMRGGGADSGAFTFHEVQATATDVRLVWSAVPQAVRYTVEVTLTDGSVAYSTETPDTVASGPRRAGTIAGYTVEAVKLDGTTVQVHRTP